MKNPNMQPWIEKGYEQFALHGPKAVRIEQLAKAIGKNKSSFYHLFGDYEVFEEALLDWHVEKAKQMSLKYQECTCIDPCYFHVVIDCKLEVFFNRQLRMHKDVPRFNEYYQKAFSMVADSSIRIWSHMLGSKNAAAITPTILQTLSDIFFSRITNENLTYDHMINIIGDVKIFFKEFMKRNNQEVFPF